MSVQSTAYAVAVQSSALDAFDLSEATIAAAASKAINKVAERARAASAKLIRTQVNFPAAYLSPAQNRLIVDRHARSEDLSAHIRGRHRPTSLARFATNPSATARRGARIIVQPGLSRFLPRAFFIPLRSGNADTKNNVGLAIRLPAGQSPSRAHKPKQIGNGLWLLYGPSIDQVFDDVAAEIAPDMAEALGDEFLRLMRLD